MKKNFIWNIIGAGSNAFISLFLVIIVTRINGLTEAGVFSYAFALACLLYCIGVYCGRIFQVTDTNSQISDSDYIHNRTITCIIMMIITVGFAFINPNHTFYKAIIICLLALFKCVEAFSEALYAIVQKNNYLYKVGISMTIKAMLGVVVFLIIDYLTKNLILSCISLSIINLLFIFVYDIINIKKVNYTKNKFNKISNKLIFINGFFTFILTFLAIYLINIPRYAINNLLTDDLQTIFGIIIMPATFMGLLGQFIIQPFLIKVKNLLISNDTNQLFKLVVKLIFSILIISIIILIGAYFLAIPILEFIYGVDLSPFKLAFMIILVGAVFYSLSVIFSAILVAMRKTLSQTIIYLVLSIIGTVLSYPLVKALNINGASITYLGVMLFTALSFNILIILSLFKDKFKKLYIKYKEIINYLIFGVLATLVSLCVKWGLLFTIFSQENAIELQISVIASWILACLFAYFTNRKFVFESKNQQKLKEFVSFFAARIFTLLLEMFIMWFFITLLKLNSDLYTFIFTIIAQIVVIIGNYIFSKLLVFKNNN